MELKYKRSYYRSMVYYRCLFLERYKRDSRQNIFLFKSSLSQMFIKKGLLKNFLKFTGKHLYSSLYLKNLLASSLQLYLKRDADTDVFL